VHNKHKRFATKYNVLFVILMHMKTATFLPKAAPAPKPLKPYAPIFGWIAGVISTLFAIVHLFRIDTLVPIVDNYLEGSFVLAAWLVASIVIVEVFSVPFALRMKLSPLAHRVSGFFLALAPLTWLLLSIWAFGLDASTGQLGEFKPVYSDVLILGLNALWLAFNFYTLWALGYGAYKLPMRKKS
jgi:hypothetical protein